jgi:hypothetical protein
MPGLAAGDMLPFRLLLRGLDVELRTVRDFGLVAPASALMFDGERGRSGETAMILCMQENRTSTDKGAIAWRRAKAESLSIDSEMTMHIINRPELERINAAVYEVQSKN